MLGVALADFVGHHGAHSGDHQQLARTGRQEESVQVHDEIPAFVSADNISCEPASLQSVIRSSRSETLSGDSPTSAQSDRDNLTHNHPAGRYRLQWLSGGP